MFRFFKKRANPINKELLTKIELDEIKKQIETISENFKVMIWSELIESDNLNTYFIEVIYDETNDKTFGLDINYDFKNNFVDIFWSAKIEDENFSNYANQVKKIKELISSILDKKSVNYDFELSQFET